MATGAPNAATEPLLNSQQRSGLASIHQSLNNARTQVSLLLDQVTNIAIKRMLTEVADDLDVVISSVGNIEADATHPEKRVRVYDPRDVEFQAAQAKLREQEKGNR
ncbi:hypothetical protein MGG_10007 [Pyricularia oryzae 70-15]|uniref:Uncharacterized protein n=3 Tax=Pyricularia oryzae TaxID=318829 RepID=G4N9D9_PYRO7|nr:uncharacterized protein MGG_10007 [Pyricularia oryzae 70-15]EHA51180.1 hypothetical protein MGG_10007 [Pyricularia oryzae 70-15]ELQ38939.1 hypothetical protein OOU_Y34scaffold00519g18 [Pyricularia oryzae Y34]KAI7917613.1 hypothetical protein M9X92_007357 [Pyricularia oryzae]KAI7918593.1 hypothetical protein M0657_007537 [Pyricularia oryzae]